MTTATKNQKAKTPKNTAYETVARVLQDSLVDLIDLSLQAKQAHWNVQGPRFKSVHEHLDLLTDEIRLAYDDVAERKVAMGFPADGRVSALSAGSGLAAYPSGFQKDTVVVDHFISRLEGLARRFRERTEVTGPIDAVTTDMLNGIILGLEKQLWMFRAVNS